MMVILFFHVMCQWGAAFQAGRIEAVLPQPWVFLLLSQGFPLLGVIGSLLIAREGSRRLWQRAIAADAGDSRKKNWALAILAFGFIGFIVVYLSQVPLRSTGLYAIFTSPHESSIARDQSVKFLANPFLRYGYSIVMLVVAPLLAVLTVQLLLNSVRQKRPLRTFLFALALAGILVTSSLSGARAYSALMVLAIVFALLLRRKFALHPLFLAVGMLLVLFFPTALTLLREGKPVTLRNLSKYFRASTVQRVMIMPMETGLYHVQYAQQHGFFGVQAVPKLARAMGRKPLNVPNFIAKVYLGDPLDTTTANTAYVYAYYSYFGLAAFIPCLIGLWLLDLSLIVFRRLSDTMLVPCVACVAIAANTFSQTEFTISLFSQGFLFLLLASWAVDRLVIWLDPRLGKKRGGAPLPGTS
jgi:hypothetical protein